MTLIYLCFSDAQSVETRKAQSIDCATVHLRIRIVDRQNAQQSNKVVCKHVQGVVKSLTTTLVRNPPSDDARPRRLRDLRLFGPGLEKT